MNNHVLTGVDPEYRLFAAICMRAKTDLAGKDANGFLLPDGVDEEAAEFLQWARTLLTENSQS